MGDARRLKREGCLRRSHAGDTPHSAPRAWRLARRGEAFGMCPLLQSTGSPLLQSTGGRRGSRWRSLRGVMLRPSTAPASTAAASQAASAMVALPSRGTPTRTGPQGNVRHCAQPATRNTASATIAAAWLGSHHGYGATEQRAWEPTKPTLTQRHRPGRSQRHHCPLVPSGMRRPRPPGMRPPTQRHRPGRSQRHHCPLVPSGMRRPRHPGMRRPAKRRRSASKSAIARTTTGCVSLVEATPRGNGGCVSLMECGGPG